MTEVLWNESGERTYEAGVDHGVLYPNEGPGVPWNGLVSVKDKTTGGETTSYYFDGEKFFQVRASTEFSATIEAFTYPIEFEECDGTKTVKPGILVTDQDRASFGLSYRTKVGNDVEGIDHGYKLHLIYNALVAPSEKNYVTIGDTLDPNNFSWDISTTPIPIPGFKFSAHLILDSRRCNSIVLESLEDIIYGRAGDPPRLPLPEEIFDLGGIVDPVLDRFVSVIATPDVGLLPPGRLTGDAVLAESDLELYYIDSTTPIEGLRDVMVLGPGEPVPGTAVAGDLIYDATTNDLYQVAGDDYIPPPPPPPSGVPTMLTLDPTELRYGDDTLFTDWTNLQVDPPNIIGGGVNSGSDASYVEIGTWYDSPGGVNTDYIEPLTGLFILPSEYTNPTAIALKIRFKSDPEIAASPPDFYPSLFSLILTSPTGPFSSEPYVDPNPPVRYAVINGTTVVPEDHNIWWADVDLGDPTDAGNWFEFAVDDPGDPQSRDALVGSGLCASMFVRSTLQLDDIPFRRKWMDVIGFQLLVQCETA